MKLLAGAQVRHLHQIKWQDRVPETQVLERAGTVSAEAMTTAGQVDGQRPASQIPDNIVHGLFHDLPTADQRIVICPHCKRACRSRGGLVTHTCEPRPSLPLSNH